MRIHITILSILVLLISGCQSKSPVKSSGKEQTKNYGSAQPNDSQIILYKKALQLLEAKEYDKSTKLLTLLSKEIPRFSGSWVNLGLIKLMKKDPVAAKGLVEQALSLSPQLPQALNLMGLIATHDRDVQLAKSYYLNAIALNSQYSNAHYNLALLYDIYLQDAQKAIDHYQQYLKYSQIEDTVTQGWVEQLKSSLSY